MAKEQFSYPGTKSLCDLIDEAGHRAGVCRGQAFEDFLACVVCALSNQQMEDDYLKIVAKGYGNGEVGRRGVESFARALATLVELMEKTRKDILGDLFAGGITYGEAGQFLTPESICSLMARISIDENEVVAEDGRSRSVADPCCGSGRMLLAAAELQPGWLFVGQDIDLRCVRMTTINLALRNRFGFVIWGNSFTNEQRLIYRTGFNMYGGVIRYARPDEVNAMLADGTSTSEASVDHATAESVTTSAVEASSTKAIVLHPARGEGAPRQLDLF